jgi:hypothetical protein
MYALAVAMMIAQPAPKVPGFKLDPVFAEAIKPDPKDPPLRKLQKERCRERATAVAMIREVIGIGNYNPDYFNDYVKLQTTLWENVAELTNTAADRVKCYELRFEAVKSLEESVRTRVAAGTEPPQSLNIARAARIDAEIDLLKLKDQVQEGGKK